MASGHGVVKANQAYHPNRQVGRERFAGTVSQPTPDGGISTRDAGMTIQNNWEALRDSGMSAEDATYQLHNLVPPPDVSTPGRAPAEGTNPAWLGPSPNSDPHQATISAALPADVAAPADTQGYEPVGFLHAILGDYRPRS